MTQADMIQLKGQDLRPHPTGHEGILTGLREVARMIREGRLNADVISWSGHKLVEAGSPAGNLSRAKALFEAFQRQYAYMHDQRGVERMAGAHLTLGNGKDKKPLLPGGDCDDACIGLGAALEAAGIPTAVVGAGYDRDRNISHVLLLVSDGNGKWVYADPSAKGYTFGQYKTPTRELIVDVLSGEILCDDTMCSPRMAGRVLDDDAHGSHFLSLNGIEGVELPRSLGMLGDLGTLSSVGDASAFAPEDVAYLQDILASMEDALVGMQDSFKVSMEVIKDMAGPQLGSAANVLFGPDEYQRSVNLEAMLTVGIQAFRQVLAGERKIGLVEGVFGVDLIVDVLPSDQVTVGFDLAKRRVELYELGGSTPVNVKGSLGAFPVLGVAIAAAVITVAIASGVVADAWSKAERAKAAAQQATASAEYELIKLGKDKELERVYEARRKLAKVEADKTPGGQVATAATAVTKGLAVVGALAVAGGLFYGLSLAMKK